jgi:hydroxymethylpyrimidine pyrophosphatase-like HAD family hydrolase
LRIVFDMDNTLTDEFGATVRPGMRKLLARLLRDGHELFLWTNSKRQRAVDILNSHNLRRFFKTCLFREDYDPEEKGLLKDIRRIRGDWLIDDDPAETRHAQSTGRRAFTISAYRKGSRPEAEELSRLYKKLSRRRSLKDFLKPR